MILIVHPKMVIIKTKKVCCDITRKDAPFGVYEWYNSFNPTVATDGKNHAVWGVEIKHYTEKVQEKKSHERRCLLKTLGNRYISQ